MDIRPGSILQGPAGLTITVGSLLGQGGFGQVFGGTMSDGTSVAVKTMLTGILSSGELESLLNEGRLAVGIVHPHVVRVLHFDDGTGAAGAPPFLVMERVDGETLADVIARRQASADRFSDAELRLLFMAIADGMEAVNARLVHRDLKPSNVLLDGAPGIAKIADFGLAKLVSAATRTETFKGWGTPPYMAPEAWDGATNTVAMDIYAAGVMFFELATFQYPVMPRPGDPPAVAWRNAHLLVVPTNARTLRSDLSVDLWQLITKMLQKDPKKRPETWAEVKASLGRVVPTGAPDVSSLVQRATERTVAEAQAATSARAAAEQAAERFQLLRNACEEPITILEEIVETFNGASDLAQLELGRDSDDGATVRQRGARPGSPTLSVHFHQIADLEIRGDGLYRVLGIVAVYPEPRPTQEAEFFKNDTFGSFNLLYRLPRSSERFGDWYQIRFEMSPLSSKRRFPHWWAHSFDDLPRELSLLNAMHVYQHERRLLDHEWFRQLLEHLV